MHFSNSKTLYNLSAIRKVVPTAWHVGEVGDREVGGSRGGAWQGICESGAVCTALLIRWFI